MKPKIGREIALLIVPFLIISGVALWTTRFGSWSGFGVPLGLKEGAPRLEIASWEKVEPSVFDYGRGISSRWKVTTWHGGACPAGTTRTSPNGIVVAHNFYFAWKRGRKWHRTPMDSDRSEFDYFLNTLRENPTKHEITLGLPLDSVPKNAEEARLRGRLVSGISCSKNLVNASSPPLDVLLKAPGEAWPQFAGSQTPVLKFQSATQRWLRFHNGKHPTGTWLIEGVFLYSSKGAPMNTLEKQRSWIVDAQGRYVTSAQDEERVYIDKGVAPTKWSVDTLELKGKTGPFTLKSWVYVDKNEWPLLVSIPLKLDKSFKSIR